MCRGCEICYFDEPSKCGVSNDVGRRKRGKNYMRKNRRILCCLNTDSVYWNVDSSLGTDLSDIHSARNKAVAAW